MNLPKKRAETGVFKEVWRSYNELVDYARSLRPARGNKNVRVRHTTQGVIYEADPGVAEPAEGGAVTMFQVANGGIQDDYLLCVESNGTNPTSGSIIPVAKPWQLRLTPFDGKSVTYQSAGNISVSFAYTSVQARTATIIAGGIGTEMQIIVPPYRFGDVIYATQPTNHTGVAQANDWVDVNCDGRAWARI